MGKYDLFIHNPQGTLFIGVVICLALFSLVFYSKAEEAWGWPELPKNVFVANFVVWSVAVFVMPIVFDPSREVRRVKSISTATVIISL